MNRAAVQRWASSAHRTVLLPGLALAALVGMIALLLQGYALVLQEREEARALLGRIEASTVPALERALWDVNEPQVEVVLEGIAQMRDVAWVSLVDERRQQRTRGKRPAGEAMERRYPLALDGAANVALGELHVVLDPDLGYETARARVLRGSLTLLLALAIAIAVLVHLMDAHLIQPLNRLAASVAAYSPESGVAPSGRHPESPPHKAAEIELLADALDRMHERIRRASDEIAALSEGLEDEKGRTESLVQQRTAELHEKNRELAQQAASLESIANTDALTGAATRRRLLEQGERQCALAGRDARPFSLLVLDVDHFKAVNDTHGHAAGDLVLRIVVACCHTQLRARDLLGRLGGEEFAILLPEADIDAAVRVAERIREGVAAMPMRLGEHTVRVTVSIGVATYRGAPRFDAMLAAADEALYRAKRSGRNRVVVERGEP